VKAAAALALVAAGGFGVSPGFFHRAQPGIAGEARRVALLVAEGAQTALRQGIGTAALRAQTGSEQPH